MTIGNIVAKLIILLLAFGFVKVGLWICRAPRRFMDIFNPYMKSYGSATLQLIWFWGLMLVFIGTTGGFASRGALIAGDVAFVANGFFSVGLCLGLLLAVRTYKRHRNTLQTSAPREIQH